GFDSSMSDSDTAEIEQIMDAAKGEQEDREPAIAAPSTPTADPATQPAATQDPATLEPEQTYSAKNAFTDLERARLGLPERQPKTPRPNEP
ncbi:hypothetical protein, partial [Streptococcus pneumoniae]|uniref:hypothetical protein n=1 Tax=Streptococcus pneumoniae TaxID=1313 RepID=UPI001E2DECC5